jgi:hypothetical protein
VHYGRLLKKGDARPEVPIKERPKPTGCAVDGCRSRHYAYGFCLDHYRRNVVNVPDGVRHRDALEGEMDSLTRLLATDDPDSVARRLGYKGWESLQRVLYRRRRVDLARMVRSKAKVA